VAAQSAAVGAGNIARARDNRGYYKNQKERRKDNVGKTLFSIGEIEIPEAGSQPMNLVKL